MGITVQEIMKRDFALLPTEPVSHAHLKESVAPLVGIALTDTAIKLGINTTNFYVDALGGFTFDNANNRFYWDSADDYSMGLNGLFNGAAGLKVTSTITGSVTIILEFRIDGNIIIETPINHTIANRIQTYAANDYLVDDTTKLPLLQQGSFWEVWARAGVGETATIDLDYFNVTVRNR